jgi:hypothetical protein
MGPSGQTKRADDQGRPLSRTRPRPGAQVAPQQSLILPPGCLQHAAASRRRQVPNLGKEQTGPSSRVNTTVPAPPCAEPPDPAPARGATSVSSSHDQLIRAALDYGTIASKYWCRHATRRAPERRFYASCPLSAACPAAHSRRDVSRSRRPQAKPPEAKERGPYSRSQIACPKNTTA